MSSDDQQGTTPANGAAPGRSEEPTPSRLANDAERAVAAQAVGAHRERQDALRAIAVLTPLERALMHNAYEAGILAAAAAVNSAIGPLAETCRADQLRRVVAGLPGIAVNVQQLDDGTLHARPDFEIRGRVHSVETTIRIVANAWSDASVQEQP